MMKEEKPTYIYTNKFDGEKYLKRNKAKIKKKDNEFSYFSWNIEHKKKQAREELQYFNKLLYETGQVAMTTIRYYYFKNEILPHRIKKIIEYNTSPDMIILEKK